MHYQLDLQFQFLAEPHVEASPAQWKTVLLEAQSDLRQRCGEETRPGDGLFLQLGLALGYHDRLTWVVVTSLFIYLCIFIHICSHSGDEAVGPWRLLVAALVAAESLLTRVLLFGF